MGGEAHDAEEADSKADSRSALGKPVLCSGLGGLLGNHRSCQTVLPGTSGSPEGFQGLPHAETKVGGTHRGN